MKDGLQVGLYFAAIAWLCAFIPTAYMAIENDKLRWPFIWAVLTTVLMGGLIVALAVVS